MILILIIFLLLIAAQNGYINVWGLTNDAATRDKAGVIWHAIGWFIRAIPVGVMVYYYWGYLPDVAVILAFSLFFGHGLYNIIINLIRGMDWDYTGSEAGNTASWIDKLFKTKWSFRIVLLIEIGLMIYALNL